MKKRFIPCPSCARHVREGDCVCPFCGAKAACAKPLRRITERLSRAAMQAAGAAGAVVALGDCSSYAGNVSYGFACCPPDACGAPLYPVGAADASDAGSADAPTDAPRADASDSGAADAPSTDASSDGGGTG
jgi:hypothetical protein